MRGSTYIREQRHICGRGYMEVDLYPVTERQHRAGRRAKRREATSLAMKAYNERRAKRHHVQLVNANFSRRDLALTLTYDGAHLPAPDDRAQADGDWGRYIRRVYHWCDRHGAGRPLWVMVTEYATADEETGKVCGRHHHHAIIQQTPGLTREVLEDLWRDARGESMGLARCERLHVEQGSVEGLVQYMGKNRRCARRWRQSRGLAMPVAPLPNDSRWSRKRLEEASTKHIGDAEFWAQRYPGYTLGRVETRVTDGGHRHTLVILWRDVPAPGGPRRGGKWHSDTDRTGLTD